MYDKDEDKIKINKTVKVNSLLESATDQDDSARIPMYEF